MDVTDPDQMATGDTANGSTDIGNRRTGGQPGEYYVYVVQLQRPIVQKRKFARENPQHVQGRPCVYVGMTGLTPEIRFENHRTGHRASRLVRHYGKRLRKDLIEGPMLYGKARKRERALAAALRARGWAVWQR